MVGFSLPLYKIATLMGWVLLLSWSGGEGWIGGIAMRGEDDGG